MRNNYKVLSSYFKPGYIPKNNYGNLNSYLEEGFQIVINPSMGITTAVPTLTTSRPIIRLFNPIAVL